MFILTQHITTLNHVFLKTFKITFLIYSNTYMILHVYMLMIKPEMIVFQKKALAKKVQACIAYIMSNEDN